MVKCAAHLSSFYTRCMITFDTIQLQRSWNCVCRRRWYESILNSVVRSLNDPLMSTETIAPIEREIRSLAIGLQSVKDEQEYIVVRERRHRDTAESTNARVKWWSILQTIVLFSVVAFQIYYLKVRHSASPLGI